MPVVSNPQTAPTGMSIAYGAGVVMYTDMQPTGAGAPFVVYAVDAKTGAPAWNTTLPPAVSGELNWDQLLCAGTLVVVVATAAAPAQAHFFGVDPATGAVQWELDFGGTMFNNYQCAGSSLVTWMRTQAVEVFNVTTGRALFNFTLDEAPELFPGSMLLLRQGGAPEPTLAVATSRKGLFAIDLVGRRLAWAALPASLVTTLSSSPDGALVAAFVGPTLDVTGEGIYLLNSTSGANVTVLAFPQSQGALPGPDGVATCYNDKMALAWSPVPSGPGRHGTLFYGGMMGNYLPVGPQGRVYWYGQVLAWEVADALPNRSALLGNLDLSVGAHYTLDPDGYMEGPLLLGDMSVDATGDAVFLSFLPVGYSWKKGPNDECVGCGGVGWGVQGGQRAGVTAQWTGGPMPLHCACPRYPQWGAAMTGARGRAPCLLGGGGRATQPSWGRGATCSPTTLHSSPLHSPHHPPTHLSPRALPLFDRRLDAHDVRQGRARPRGADAHDRRHVRPDHQWRRQRSVCAGPGARSARGDERHPHCVLPVQLSGGGAAGRGGE